MPADMWTEAARMTTSGLIVAAAAVPVGLLARSLRPASEPLLPRWKPWRVPWSGFEVTGAFFVVTLVLPGVLLSLLSDGSFYQDVHGPDFPRPNAAGVDEERAKEASTLRVLWANLFALPLALALLWVVARTLYPAWKPRTRGSAAGKVWLAVVAWAALTPAVLVFNFVVNTISERYGVTPDTHALTKLGAGPVLGRVLFALEACVAAPLREELVFRGLLLSWCVGRMRIPGAGVEPITNARPWLVMFASCASAALLGEGRAAPVIFAGVLAVGLAALWRFKHTGARRARAVYATAAFFAVVHSGVWPNPVPLFALGLGLGWLAVRTNGILVPVLVHALFNAVSVVFVLRGGAG